MKIKKSTHSKPGKNGRKAKSVYRGNTNGIYKQK